MASTVDKLVLRYKHRSVIMTKNKTSDLNNLHLEKNILKVHKLLGRISYSVPLSYPTLLVLKAKDKQLDAKFISNSILSKLSDVLYCAICTVLRKFI